MGWRSTMDITREDALKEIMGKLLRASDDELEDVLLSLFEDSLYNYNIVSRYEDEDDEDYYRRYRGSIE